MFYQQHGGEEVSGLTTRLTRPFFKDPEDFTKEEVCEFKPADGRFMTTLVAIAQENSLWTLSSAAIVSIQPIGNSWFS